MDNRRDETNMKESIKHGLMCVLVVILMLIIKGILDGANAPRIAYILVGGPIILHITIDIRSNVKDMEA